jgi:hypothetical protein
MNGAESLARTLVAGGVDTCFANPGTSEMHFVSALDGLGAALRARPRETAVGFRRWLRAHGGKPATLLTAARLAMPR